MSSLILHAISSSSDDELFKLLGTELERRISAKRDSPEFLAEIRSLPVGLRAMAATYELDVSLVMDDLGWPFGNWHSEALAEETAHGLEVLGAPELASVFREAFRLAQRYWSELGAKTWSQWYHGSPLEQAVEPLSEQARKFLEDGIFHYWVDYACRWQSHTHACDFSRRGSALALDRAFSKIQNWRNSFSFVNLASVENKRIATKVGLFVFIGLVLIAGAVILFSKGTSLFHGTYNLRLRAVNVGGLKKQATVSLAGVQVGNVSDIQLADDGKSVTIFLKIYNRYRIYHDARFVIEQQGFLGDNYVSIISVSNQPPVLTNNEEVQCQEPFNLQEVARGAAGFVQRVDTIAKKLDDSVNQMQRVVLNAQTMTNFAVSVENLRSFTEQAMGAVNDINQMIATNGAQVGLAVSNVLLMSGDVHGLIVSNAPVFTASMKNIETSTKILTNLMTQIQSGKGLAGTMLANQEMATNVQVIANNLAIASSNLNRLGLWHFLWHKEKLPAKKK